MPPTASARDSHVYVFDGFVLDPYRRSLAHGEDEIALGSRALEILIALIERAGEVVGRDELVARVWPRTIVEESSLRVHVSALRRALGDGRRYIANVPGRGYGFFAEVALRPRMGGLPEPAALPPTGEADRPGLLPVSTSLWGRDTAKAAVERLMGAHRLVTVVGPGGVGKTSLAAQLAAASAGASVYLVDLAAAGDAGTAAQCLARAIGIDPERAASALGALRGAACLIVLDNCEHLADTVAHLAQDLLATAPGVCLLVTSREPLNIDGECVYRLDPLALPEGRVQTLAELTRWAGVRLFVERVRASGHDLDLGDADAPDLAELCRQLDGLPLVLELAAARVGALGLRGLLARIDELPSLLTRGRRSAQPRHRSLQALIDSSYGLLAEPERRALRALSVFPGPFSLTQAGALIGRGDDATRHADEELVLRLVEKSLVLAAPVEDDGIDADGTCYRLLHTTRRYAAARLHEAAEEEAVGVAERHARLCRRLAVSETS